MKLLSSIRTHSGSSSNSGSGKRLVAVLACVLGLQSAFAADTCPQTTNAFSQFPVIIDGRFTPDSIIVPTLAAAVFPPNVHEWSDVTPQAFITDLNTGALFRTCPDDPNANSFVYTALAPGETGGGSADALYLMYDFVGQKLDPGLFAPGQVLAQVTFGVHLPPPSGGGEFPGFGGTPDANGNTQITVKFKVPQFVIGRAAVVGGGGGGQIPVDVVFDVLNGQSDVPSSALFGLQGAASFGSSPNSPDNHLQAELEVGLRVPAGFGTPGGPLPGGGIDPSTGLYDPAPKFWGSGFESAPGGGGGGGIGFAARAAAAPVSTFLPASANIVTINPNGSVNVNSGANAGRGFVPFAGLSAKKNVSLKLVALRSQLTGRNLRELNEAIDLLGRSLAIGLFTDPARPNPIGGSRVFRYEGDAVDELSEIIRSKPTLPNALIGLLRDAIDKMVGADAEFATTAIQDAIAAGKDPRIIAAAKRELAEGDRAAARGRNEDAIEEYQEAWSIVVGGGRR